MDIVLGRVVGVDLASLIIKMAKELWKDSKTRELTHELESKIVSAKMKLNGTTVFMFNNTDLSYENLQLIVSITQKLKTFSGIDGSLRLIILNWLSSIYFNMTPSDYKVQIYLNKIEDLAH